MKPEIIEALILELTKGKMAQKYVENPTDRDITSAFIWVKTYLESEKEIKDIVNKPDENN